MRKNPKVAISIFNSQAPEGEGDRVYIKATVTELTDLSQIEAGMVCFNSRASKNEFKIFDIDKVTNDGIWRIYRATPTEVSKLTEGTFVNGQYIDQRVVADLLSQ